MFDQNEVVRLDRLVGARASVQPTRHSKCLVSPDPTRARHSLLWLKRRRRSGHYRCSSRGVLRSETFHVYYILFFSLIKKLLFLLIFIKRFFINLLLLLLLFLLLKLRLLVIQKKVLKRSCSSLVAATTACINADSVICTGASTTARRVATTTLRQVLSAATTHGRFVAYSSPCAIARNGKHAILFLILSLFPVGQSPCLLVLLVSS